MQGDREETYRDKYLALVDEVVEKEREWNDIGAKLPHFLSNLLIIADGPRSRDISTALEQMRDGLKKGNDFSWLEESMANLREKVLEETRYIDAMSKMPPVHEVLIELIEQIPIPHQFCGKAFRIITNLERGVSLDGLNESVRDICWMIVEIRSAIQEEKRQLEELLQEVEGKLKEIGGGITTTQEESQRGAERSEEFDQAVRDKVDEINESATVASDIETFRRELGGHLETIQNRLAEKRTDDSERAAKMGEELSRMREQVQMLEREVDEQRKRVAESMAKAMIDPLTECSNRLAYLERVDAEIARARGCSTPLALVCLDVDDFKRINNGFGHTAGDRAMKAIAKISAAQLREIDFFARLSGDEFVILLPGTDPAGAAIAAEKVRAGVENFKFHDKGERVRVTVTCGVSCYTGGDTREELLGRAYLAIHAGKAGGKNRVVTQEEL